MNFRAMAKTKSARMPGAARRSRHGESTRRFNTLRRQYSRMRDNTDGRNVTLPDIASANCIAAF
jgi:hypothetical protein